MCSAVSSTDGGGVLIFFIVLLKTNCWLELPGLDGFNELLRAE